MNGMKAAEWFIRIVLLLIWYMLHIPISVSGHLKYVYDGDNPTYLYSKYNNDKD